MKDEDEKMIIRSPYITTVIPFSSFHCTFICLNKAYLRKSVSVEYDVNGLSQCECRIGATYINESLLKSVILGWHHCSETKINVFFRDKKPTVNHIDHQHAIKCQIYKTFREKNDS